MYCNLADSHFSLANLTTWILHLAATTMEATVNRALHVIVLLSSDYVPFFEKRKCHPGSVGEH